MSPIILVALMTHRMSNFNFT